MSTITIKRNDTKQLIEDTLLYAGAALDLTGTTVKFLMSKGALRLSLPATISPTPTDGKVSIQAVADIVDTEGEHRQEWEVTFADGKVLTVPSEGYNTINIVADLS